MRGGRSCWGATLSRRRKEYKGTHRVRKTGRVVCHICPVGRAECRRACDYMAGVGWFSAASDLFVSKSTALLLKCLRSGRSNGRGLSLERITLGAFWPGIRRARGGKELNRNRLRAALPTGVTPREAVPALLL